MTTNPFSPILNTAVESIITLAVAPISVTEDGINNLIYTFTRTGATTNALTVKYDLTGTADSTDYTGATPGTGKTITFAIGSSTAILTIDPKSDTQEESDETVVLTLATATGYTIGTTSAVTGTILTDDYPIKQWTKLLGTSSVDRANALTTGNDGAIYVSGYTEGNLDGQTNSGGGDAFITKYNPDGTKVWTKLLGTSYYAYANALTTGKDGAIYVSGYTQGNLDGQTNSGYSDVFITKYNPDGTKVWTKLLGTSGYDHAEVLTTGNDGAIYVSGRTSGNLDGQTYSGGIYDAFITKYNPNGTKVWTKLLGTSDTDYASALTIGNDGAIYVSGYTSGNLDGQTNSGYSDAFITKYNPDGTKVWTKLLGTSGYYDYAYGLTTGNDGAIYVSGYTYGNLDGQTNSGSGDAFVTKYNPDGTKVWTKLLGTSNEDGGDALTTGKDGAIYVSGAISRNLDSGSGDAFIAKYNPDGTIVWTKLLGTSSYDYAYDLTTGNDGAIYVSGFTGGNLDAQINSGGSYDAFIAKYNPDGTKVWTKLLGTSGDDQAFALTTDNDGAIYVSGLTSDNLDGQTNSGTYDAFITKYQDAPPVTITLAVAPTSVTEDGTPNLVYTFTRTGATTNPLTVNYTIAGTATNGTDYATIGTSVTFAANSATAIVTVNPTADTTIENNETVALTLATGTGYIIGTTTAVTGTITNDDVATVPNITLAVAPASVIENGTPNLVYTFTRTGATTSALTVTYSIGGTATNGTDYTTIGSSVTFAAGSTTATVTVDPTADTTIEANETVALTLATGTGYTIGTTTAVTGTITNDDFPSISINDITVIEGKDLTAPLTLSLSSPSPQTITVNYTITAVDATANLDYTTSTGTLTFAANSTTATLSIPILNDNLNEEDESFFITLSNPTNATLNLDANIGEVIISDTLQSSLTRTLPANVENLKLIGTAAINGTGNAGNNVLTGNSGNNTLAGLAGNDTYSFPANTLLGTDTITETTTGGIDTLNFSGTNNQVRLNLGSITNQTVVTGNLILKLSAVDVIENVIGGNSGDRLTGNSLNNSLDGSGGNDNLSGGNGVDTLTGGTGDDLLTGGAGNDSFGYITGKAFTTGDIGLDTLTDFTPTADKLLLSKTTFSALTSIVGNGFSQATNFAVVEDDFLVETSNAFIVYSSNSGSLFYNQNGNAAGLGTGAEFAVLISNPILTSNDFTLIA